MLLRLYPLRWVYIHAFTWSHSIDSPLLPNDVLLQPPLQRELPPFCSLPPSLQLLELWGDREKTTKFSKFTWGGDSQGGVDERKKTLLCYGAVFVPLLLTWNQVFLETQKLNILLNLKLRATSPLKKSSLIKNDTAALFWQLFFLMIQPLARVLLLNRSRF